MAVLDGKKGTLTERDGKLLRDLYLARYLSTPQIHRLHFGSESRTKMRLSKLGEKGWVRNMPFVDPLGRQRVCWRLTKEGFEMQAASVGMEDERWTPKQLGPDRARHYVQTNEVYVAARKPLARVPSLDATLGPYPNWEWLNEARASDSYDTPYTSGRRHQPDAEVWFCEALFVIERQTSLSRVKRDDIFDKVGAHKSYFEYGFDDPPGEAAVLFACDDRRVMEIAREAGHRHGVEVVADIPEMIGAYLCQSALRLP